VLDRRLRPVTVNGRRSAFLRKMKTPQRGWMTSRGFFMAPKIGAAAAESESVARSAKKERNLLGRSAPFRLPGLPHCRNSPDHARASAAEERLGTRAW
jgi:hypothetical protein